MEFYFGIKDQKVSKSIIKNEKTNGGPGWVYVSLSFYYSIIY